MNKVSDRLLRPKRTEPAATVGQTDNYFPGYQILGVPESLFMEY